MNAGQRTIDWLFREQLRVDAEWSVRDPNGFTWWADKNAQRIEVVDTQVAEDGLTGYSVRVQTEFLRGVELTERNLIGVNHLLMPFVSMAGPVYSAAAGALGLSSLVVVHEGNEEWMRALISLASVLQIAEARIMAPLIAKRFGAEVAESEHPENGLRPEADEIAHIVANLVAPMGKKPCAWRPSEFEEAVSRYMLQPPSLGASSGGTSLTVEFPYGDASSLSVFRGDTPHPRYGNGLFLMQTFPVATMQDSEGMQLALDLNRAELSREALGYGFGSYCYRDDMMHFTCFIPNAGFRPGLMGNFYFSCAERAQKMSARFTENNWTSPSLEMGRSAAHRFRTRTRR